MKVSDFFAKDYVDQASYDNLRKIASLVDGQKNAARKILYTVLSKKIKSKVKVSQLGSKVAEFSEYLHGDLSGVIVNLGQDFAGTNNIPLMQKKGNFGTKFDPFASAARYIYSYGSDAFFNIFKSEDVPVLKKQFFEGQEIEPMFYVPSLPILLINGSEGVSSGFAQKILPRNPKEIIRYINAKLAGKKSNVKFEPYYEGFNGVIEQGENSTQWLIKGIIKRKNFNTVVIKEVPVGYSLKGYLKVLDTLEDKKIIQGYRDKSENDNFLFEINILGKNMKKWSDETLMTKLKLIKTTTENYTVVDENNKIQVYNNVQEILDKYIEIKLLYLEKRKQYQIKKFDEEIRFDFSKYLFIKMVLNSPKTVNNRKKADIVKDLNTVKNILKKEGTYDYLLNIPILSLTQEKVKKLESDMKKKKGALDRLKKQTTSDIWKEDM